MASVLNENYLRTTVTAPGLLTEWAPPPLRFGGSPDSFPIESTLTGGPLAFTPIPIPAGSKAIRLILGQSVSIVIKAVEDDANGLVICPATNPLGLDVWLSLGDDATLGFLNQGAAPATITAIVYAPGPGPGLLPPPPSPPIITSLSASHGHPGDALILTGLHFGALQGTGGVKIDGITATVTSWSATAATVTVPTRGSYPDTGNVVLTTGGALVSNGVPFTTNPPYALKAAGFASASAEYLWAPSSPSLDLAGSSFTLALWFNATDRSTWGVALAKAGLSNATISYYCALNYGAPGEIGFFIANGSTLYQPANLNFPTAGVWNLWIGQVDLAALTVSHSLNLGAPASTAGPAAGCDSTAVDFFLGTYGASHTVPAGNYLNAALDSPMIWNRVLTTAEHAAVYSAGVGLATQDLQYVNGGSLLTGLSAAWDLDGAVAGLWADASGNGNTLQSSVPPPTAVAGLR